MKTVTTGTLVDHIVQLDCGIDLPDHTRVSVSIEPLADDAQRLQAALARFFKRADQRAFDSGGCRFTRDQLHARR